MHPQLKRARLYHDITPEERERFGRRPIIMEKAAPIFETGVEAPEPVAIALGGPGSPVLVEACRKRSARIAGEAPSGKHPRAK